ncbi:MAG TPA: diguanylate cyclase [Verrucomicrobiae bacterium]|nr:diguanylate cyclase [Verrucomicrobiae bacterium]
MNPQILVVDDYAFNRLIYRDWLTELRNVDIVEAADGTRALQLAATHDFALCLFDVNLPDMTGFSLTSRFRALPNHSHTPVMLVTSEMIEPKHQLQAYESGAVDYVTAAVTHGATLSRKAALFVELWRQRQALLKELRELRGRLNEADLSRNQLRIEATHDALTGLPNRTLFRDRAQAASHRAARARTMFALAYVDLDGFKAVNDAHGHAAGDALLVAVATRLTQTLRASDTVARLGGDEFGLLLENIDGPFRAEVVADKLHRALCQPYEINLPEQVEKIVTQVGASIGLAVYPDHGVDADRLLFRADVAMYAAKQDGGGARLYRDNLASGDAIAAEGPRISLRERPTLRH